MYVNISHEALFILHILAADWMLTESVSSGMAED